MYGIIFSVYLQIKKEMNKTTTAMKQVILCLMLLLGINMSASSENRKAHTFTMGDKTFLLDGKPFVVKAAEIHYMRIPHEYWEHRIRIDRKSVV